MKKMFLILLSLALCAGVVFTFPSLTAQAKEQEYEIVGKYQNGDLIISNISVTDFGAKGDGQTDDTEAISKALKKASAQGGGIVFLPAGKYRVTSSLSVPANVTLTGVWLNPEYNPSFDKQTVLLADYKSNGKVNGSAYFISLTPGAGVKGLNIYYPQQNAASPTEYPFTIGLGIVLVNISDITLLNSYAGIKAGTASHVENIYGTCYKYGFYNTANYEISNFVNLNFSGKYLNRYDKTPVEDIKKGCSGCVPVKIGKTDDLFLYDVKIDEEYYKNEITVELEEFIPVSPKQAYGHAGKLNGAKIKKTEEDYYVKLSNEDDIEGVAEGYSHKLQTVRRPKSDNLYVVTDFGAKGDGKTDDSSAVNQAINKAKSNGGGTVFFSAGKYVISEYVTVPSGVELRGAWDNPLYRSGSVLSFSGKQEKDKAFVTLSSDSGVHGFTIEINNYDYNDIGKVEYPWIFRGNGKNVWVENITFISTYRGIDMASYKCDNFLIRGIWGTCTHGFISVGGGTAGGVLEYVMCTYGTWWEEIARASDNISECTYKNAVGLTLGDCSDIAVFSFSTFGIKTSLLTNSENGKGVENLRIIRLVSDLPNGFNNVEFNAGNNIAIIGLSTGGGIWGSKAVKINPSFDGKLRIYGQIIWGGSAGVSVYPNKDYASYNEKSVDVEILKFDFPWEKGNFFGSTAFIVIASCAAVVIAGAIVAVILVKKKKGKTNGKKENTSDM